MSETEDYLLLDGNLLPASTKNRAKSDAQTLSAPSIRHRYKPRVSRHSTTSGVSSSSRSYHTPCNISSSLRRSIRSTISNNGRSRSPLSARRDGRITRSNTSCCEGRNSGVHLKLGNRIGCSGGIWSMGYIDM